MPKAVITGTGSYLPSRVLSNSDLEKMVDTNDEWIVTRTGMKERRIASSGEAASDMGVKAALAALEKAGASKEDVDLVLVATITPDYVFPSTACLIQASLGLQAAAVDLQAACSGYIYAISIAKAFVESGLYKGVLVVASEKLSTIVDYTDRNTCVLFGDGASCAFIQADGKQGLLIGEISLGADGEQGDLLKLPAGGSRMPASKESVEEKQHYLKMEGKETFKHAVRRMEQASKECMDKMQLSDDKISWYVPHQANTRIIEAIAKRFQVPMERVYLTIQKYGNTSSSSIGIALDELVRNEPLENGDNLLLTAFGAGLTWGACILTLKK